MDSSSSHSPSPSSSRRPPSHQRLVRAPVLHLALGFGNPSAGANLSVDDRVALLLRAAYEGYAPKVKRLAKRLEEKAGMSVDEAVAGVEAPWSKGHGPLHMAASAGKVKVCKFLIEDLKLNVNATGTDG
ncbi:uncharacterized protein LOC133901317 [Phragmites australis]|uniref:uncharacterized protein LOC133901317 n=1 Tax=Phragmites australis TaxID=29695 RepID=UPI002D767CF4|nr:uncharacterized protein LOC133901317 [Phragmites australis]